ncbi:Protein of unknown function [Escherichia coli D6-113.11]
MPDAV